MRDKAIQPLPVRPDGSPRFKLRPKRTQPAKAREVFDHAKHDREAYIGKHQRLHQDRIEDATIVLKRVGRYI